MAPTDDAILTQRLLEALGPEQVAINAPVEIAGQRSRLVVTPGAFQEVADALRIAREEGAAVTPLGGGTQQRAGAPPQRLDVVLATRRLDEVVEWEPADLTACLQAGMTLAAVQSMLAGRGQQLAVDAPVADRATLGGLVATNTVGPRRWRYGSWRDLIIGMHSALTDGSVIKSGGRVVKNVQGYDLGKLFTGSLGTLGVIVQVNVRLVPLPASRRLLAAHGALEAVAGFLETAAASTMRVSSVDLLDEEAARTVGLAQTGYAGLVLLEDQPAVVDAGSVRLEELANETGARSEEIDGEALEPVWRAWVDLGRTDDLGPSEALLSISTLPVHVAEVMQTLKRVAETHALTGRCWARAGNGSVYARLGAPADAAATLAVAQGALLERWPATALAAGDAAIARLARPWGIDPPELTVMRLLKQRFDPTGTLQSGRYVGGI